MIALFSTYTDSKDCPLGAITPKTASLFKFAFVRTSFACLFCHYQVLKDGMLENLTPQLFLDVNKPKNDGIANLDM